jgi:hypothetical protein
MCWRCCGIGSRHWNLKAHQQVELLARFVVPELSRADVGAVLNERHMPVVAGVGQGEAPAKRQDAHLLVSLEAVVMA